MEEPQLSREQLVIKYFNEGYKHSEIVSILEKHGECIGIRQLRRVLKSLGLIRKNKHEDFNKIIPTVIEELKGSGSCLGYKSMWKRLKTKHELEVRRDTVLDILKGIDPEGIEMRSKKRLNRREYYVPGPNYVWHLDCYEKLKPYGFSIHGCVDGFSRKVLWFDLGVINKKPEVVAYYFGQQIKKRKLVPNLVRSDCGTENVNIEAMHKVFKINHEDNNAEEKSCLEEKRTAIQRIENTWGRLRDRTINFYINLFKDIKDGNHFNKCDELQLECLRFCFSSLIQQDLNLTRQKWNRHTIRKQKNDNIVAGKPNDLYYLPQEYERKQCGFEVSEDETNRALAMIKKPKFWSEAFGKLVKVLFSDNREPNNAREAVDLYHRMMNTISRL